MKKILTEEQKMQRTIARFKSRFQKTYGVPVSVLQGVKKKDDFITLQKVKETVERVANCNISEKNRKKNVVYARHCYSKISKDLGFSLKSIAANIERDHSSIINGCHKANDFTDSNDPLYASMYNEIIKELK